MNARSERKVKWLRVQVNPFYNLFSYTISQKLVSILSEKLSSTFENLNINGMI